MIALLVALAALRAQEQPYVWSTSMPGESVQFGVPSSDDRALRIDCAADGLHILGTAVLEFTEDVQTEIVFRSGGHQIRLRGRLVEMGDGMNFDVRVAAASLPIETLLRGEDLVVVHGGMGWTVSGEGAAAVLRPLVEACASRS